MQFPPGMDDDKAFNRLERSFFTAGDDEDYYYDYVVEKHRRYHDAIDDEAGSPRGRATSLRLAFVASAGAALAMAFALLR